MQFRFKEVLVLEEELSYSKEAIMLSMIISLKIMMRLEMWLPVVGYICPAL